MGIDVGLEAFAVLSDGTRIEAPKPLAKALRLLKRRSKQLSRKQKRTVVEQDPETGEERKRTVFSRNYEKAALRLARLQRRIRNIRRDFLHKVTTELAKTKPVLVVEDLNVRGLARSPYLSRSILDVGWGMFQRMLEYKCRWYGSVLITAPRHFPSTRMCSRCGWIGPALPLSRRVFRCEACGLEMDRDLNAALNLRNYGLATLNSPTGSSPGSDACGVGATGRSPLPRLWRRNGPQGSVYELWVDEAGSGRSLVSPFGVKSMTMRCGTVYHRGAAHRIVSDDGSGGAG